MAVPAITNNSPSAGSIAWGAFSIQYMGVSYSIGAGSTSARWVWWRYNNGSSVIEAGADIPANLTDDDLVLFGNKNGIGIRVQATSVIDGELLVDGSIFADALSTNLIRSEHIVTAGLDAGVIKFGTMSGDRLAANSIQATKLAISDLTDYISDPALRQPSTWPSKPSNTVIRNATDSGVPANSPTDKVADLQGFYDGFWDINNPLPATPGDKFYVSADVYYSGTGTNNMSFRLWCTNQPSYPGGGWSYPGFSVTPAQAQGKWARVSGVIAVPATSSQGGTSGLPIRYAFPGLGTGGPGNNGWWMTNWSVRRMNKGELIVDGAIKSTHVVTEGLDAGVIKFGLMHGDRIDVNTLNANRITAASLKARIVEAEAVNGITITGTTVQTAATGERMIMRNDGSGGVLESYTGLPISTGRTGSQETPSYLNPYVNGEQPGIALASGTFENYTKQASLTLWSNTNIFTGGSAVLKAAEVFLSTDSSALISVSSATGKINLNAPNGIFVSGALDVATITNGGGDITLNDRVVITDVLNLANNATITGMGRTTRRWDFGNKTGTTDASGNIVVAHDCQKIPDAIVVTGNGNAGRSYAVISKSSTQFQIRVTNASGAAQANVATDFFWWAIVS